MKYIIYGLGISGISALKFFASKNFVNKNFEVIATDDNLQTLENIKIKLINENPQLFSSVKFLKSDDIIFNENTTIITAPGIPLYFPKTHKIVEISKRTKAKLICDIEEFYLNNQSQNFIGITGTNGKSTTTALSGFIFKELNLPSEIGGNIGLPCFELANLSDYENKKTYIFETSSYQLDLVDKTRFKIAALLNITPDHIDHHGSMQGYIDAKKNIFKNQIEGDYAIINVDNINSKAVFDELKKDQNFKATLIPISTKQINDGGVSVINNILYNRTDYLTPVNSSYVDNSSYKVVNSFSQVVTPFSQVVTPSYDGVHKMSGQLDGCRPEDGMTRGEECVTRKEDCKKIEGINLGDIFLKGEHNAENIAVAFAITYCYLKQENLLEKITEFQIIEAIKKFKGLKHRLQFIGTIDDVKFINDSKATNAESTENALKAYDNIFWILGGRAKEGGISILNPYFNKIKKAYLIGEASEDFAKVLETNSVEFEKCGNLENAIKKSFNDAKKYSLKEKNIILSPACASLDQWKNFEERGDFFCKMFNEIQSKFSKKY